MKISIVTPSYNQANYLEETILSVINQDYPNLEYIIIDGGSSDDSVAIIKKYEKHIAYWTSEKDNGQSHAINKGFKQSSGDIITWINSDDVLLPNALNKVAEYFDVTPDTTGVIHGGTVLFDDKRELRKVYTYGGSSIEKCISTMAFSQPSAFFRKSYLERVGLLHEDLHFGMDYDLFARLACVCEFRAVDTIFSKYRLHNESKSVASNEKFRADWNRIFVSLCHHLNWIELLEEAIRLVPALEKESRVLEYQFLPNDVLLSKVDKKKVLFYFLCDLLLHYYWYDDRIAARNLLQRMELSFDKSWFNNDKRVRNVVRKLKVPDVVLRSLKTLKQYLKKR